jgi:hypothetical protein
MEDFDINEFSQSIESLSPEEKRERIKEKQDEISDASDYMQKQLQNCEDFGVTSTAYYLELEDRFYELEGWWSELNDLRRLLDFEYIESLVNEIDCSITDNGLSDRIRKHSSYTYLPKKGFLPLYAIEPQPDGVINIRIQEHLLESGDSRKTVADACGLRCLLPDISIKVPRLEQAKKVIELLNLLDKVFQKELNQHLEN